MKPVLTIPRWREFQHYKDRRPVWIKAHTELLLDDEWHELPDAGKAHVFGLWLLAANYDGKIPFKPNWIAKQIGASDAINWSQLIESKFIELNEAASDLLHGSASETLALARSREEEAYKPEAEKNLSSPLETRRFSSEPSSDPSGPASPGEESDPKPEPTKLTTKREPKVWPEDSREVKAALYLWGKIRGNNPAAREPNLQRWAREFDLIFRVDKRSPKDVWRLIDWTQADSFWLGNVLSPATLREHFDRLTVQSRASPPRSGDSRSSATRPIVPAPLKTE